MCERFLLFSECRLSVIQKHSSSSFWMYGGTCHTSSTGFVPPYGVCPRLLHELPFSRADGPSLERLYLSAVPLLLHHCLHFHSAEQPHGAVTPSASCRIMISFPFLPNKNNVTCAAGIYRGQIPASHHDIGVVSTSVGTPRERE